MFSVIIPLYNKALYVEKAIQSILFQTFQQFEVIIVNDGSTDNSLDIINQLDFSGFDVTIINQKNSGVSTARNNGVKYAKYDYIAFLDADDWWESAFLEEMKVLIEKYPQAGIYGSSYYLVKNGRKKVASIGVENDFKEGIINYCQVYAKTLCMPLCTGAVIIPREVFKEQNGFKPNLRLGEDFDLWIRIVLKCPVAFFYKPLSNYNQDVEQKGRAVGNLHPTASHMLWNLEYLVEEELKNEDLKLLLDNLRVYGLYPYYLNKSTRKEAEKELLKVDWTKQPVKDKKKYTRPIFYSLIERNVRFMLYKIKSNLLKTTK